MNTNNQKITFPKGWILVELSDIAYINMGQSPPSSSYNEEKIGLPFMQGKTEFGNIYPIIRYYCSEPLKIADKGDVLISIRAPIGPTNLVFEKMCIGRGLASIKGFGKITGEFILYQLRAFERDIEKLGTGTTFQAISKTNLEKLNFLLPPLNEQMRIVSKIEELFSRLEHAEKGFKEAKKLLNLYKRRILIRAVKGDLEEQSDKNLPKGWRWIMFKDLCKIQRGYDLPLSSIKKGRFPVVTSSGIKDYHNKYKAKGPCLTTGRSGSVGSTFFCDVDYYWPHNTVLFVKDFNNNIPKYLYYFFLQLDFESFSSSTTVPTLDRKQLYSIPVPLPPVNNQLHIVQELDSSFSIIENLENDIEGNLKGIIECKVSILKKAYSGTLVPQYPTDENAEYLLEKIKYEKELYLKSQRDLVKSKSRRGKQMGNNKTPKEILIERKEPIEAKELWLQSKFKDDIDMFYASLKEIENAISITKKGKSTLIGMKDENR